MNKNLISSVQDDLFLSYQEMYTGKVMIGSALGGNIQLQLITLPFPGAGIGTFPHITGVVAKVSQGLSLHLSR